MGGSGSPSAPTSLSEQSVSAMATPEHISSLERSSHGTAARSASPERAGVTARKRRAEMLYPVLTPHSRMPLKHRIWMTFESPSFSRAAFWYAQFSLLIITTSTITFCLESELNCKAFSVQGHNFVTDSNCETWENAWVVCEVVAVVCFTVELLLRFITSPSRWLFLQNLMNWVDFVAVLPFFLEQIIGAVEAGQESGSGESDSPLGALSVFRVIRLVRVFRVFKMGKSSAGARIVASTMLDSAKVLSVLVFMVGIAVIVYSAAVFSFEQSGANAADFESIPRTSWWALVTMTTVGYGDITPVTTFGRMVAVLTMFSGIIIVALPITVIGANFEQQFEKQSFQDAVIDRCTKKEDGSVNYDKLMELFTELHQRGNLQVELPESVEKLKRVVERYDVLQNGKLDAEDWSALLLDCVCEAHEFTDVTVQKVVLDVDKLATDMKQMQQLLSEYRRASDFQFEQLMALVNGDPPPKPPEGFRTAHEVLATASSVDRSDSPSQVDARRLPAPSQSNSRELKA